MENSKQLKEIIEEINNEVKSFVLSYIDSFIKWDLIKLFFENQNNINTIDNIAKSLGRDKDTIIPEINDLTSKGLFITTQDEIENTTNYHFTNDLTLKEQAQKFLEFCNHRESRLKIIFLILKGKNK